MVMKKIILSGFLGLFCTLSSTPIMSQQNQVEGVIFEGKCDVLFERNFDNKLNIPCKLTKDPDNFPDDKLFIDGVGYTINNDFEKTVVMGGEYGFKEFKMYHPRYGITYKFIMKGSSIGCIKNCE